MKTNQLSGLIVGTAISLCLLSCKKENSVSTSANSANSLANIISSIQAVAVGTTSSSSSSQADSIYIIGTCGRDEHRDSIAAASLPSAITSYLTTNYSGYTFLKAFTVKNNSGTVTGYVVAIQYNDKPVGLKFDASGNFVAVLEQREGRDLTGSGWHEGGRFDDRDGRGRDSIAISSLPQVITSYFATNYPGDTLVKAFYGKDSSYIVISKNNGGFVTVFNAQGAFVERVSLPAPHEGKLTTVDQASLPTSIQNYLNTTYPGYTFKQAFSATVNGTVQGYVVFISANNTRYAVEFDASGNFVKAVTIR